MNPTLDGVPGGVISLSSDLRVVSANRGIGDLVGRDPTAIVGQSVDVLLSAPSRILFQTNVYPALGAEGRVEEVFLTLAAADGSLIPVLLNAVRVSGPDGPTYDALIVRILARAKWETELLAAARDIERERASSQRLAEELAATADDLAARYAAEERNRAFRDAFIGVISHELRTPITTIYGMSHLLRVRSESMAPEAIREHLGDIESESDRLRRLTEDLLVLSRAEGGGLQVATDPIIVGHVVTSAVESERTRSAGHDFTMAIAPGLPIVLGEDLYLEQVVRNYLSNAAKYSPAGTTVRVAVTGEAGGVAVRVIDAGPGLAGEAPEHLFDLFYRAPRAVREAAGAGIGLFVCRELIQAMGGRVWAAQAPAGSEGHGAEFGLWLPAADELGDE